MIVAKLFFLCMAVLHVFLMPHYGHAGRSSKVHRSTEKVEKLKHLNLSNKHPVKSIKSPDGDIIDCVHISQQPAFDHPNLKNHTNIKTRPSYQPNWIGSLTSPSKEPITQLWHSKGKCPKGTIPIRKTNKEDLLKASSVKSYRKKNIVDSELANEISRHEYAYAATEGLFYGTKATFSLWNPKPQEHNEFSLSQLWISRGQGSELNTIEAGWQVYPDLYKDTNTRLFIYWTRDEYKTTGCYNLGCSGFIQTNNEIALGGTISPTSQVDGSQYHITILIWKDPKEGHWWMQLDGSVIGYWPASLFSHLSKSASEIQWGGEVVNQNLDGHHTTTDMGSGHFPVEGAGKASDIKNIQTVDESITLRTPERLIPFSPEKSCYDIVIGMNDNSGSNFFYGGPGRNPNCP